MFAGTSANFANLEFDWDISFRFPLDADSDNTLKFNPDPLGDLRRVSTIVKERMEHKDDEKGSPPVIVDDYPAINPPSSTPKLKLQLTNQRGISSGQTTKFH